MHNNYQEILKISKLIDCIAYQSCPHFIKNSIPESIQYSESIPRTKKEDLEQKERIRLTILKFKQSNAKGGL